MGKNGEKVNLEKVCLKGERGNLYLSERLGGKFGVSFWWVCQNWYFFTTHA